MRTPVQALDALRERPCGARALEVLRGAPGGGWVVGGAVRDALLGGAPREIDLVVEGDPEPVARALGEVIAVHERFGTWDVADGDCLFDVVRSRAESYAAPGALPDVRPGTLDDDLARRDFTVNALALGPGGELRGAPGALEDLRARRLRVLHPESFRDDPTRLWRLVRYAVRLGFTPEPETERLAVEGVDEGALAAVKGGRARGGAAAPGAPPATPAAPRPGPAPPRPRAEPEPLSVLHAARNLGLAPDLHL